MGENYVRTWGVKRWDGICSKGECYQEPIIIMMK